MEINDFKKLAILIVLKTVFARGLSNNRANILVFGGNGFIGAECVNSLLHSGHRITLVNRGSHYYDSEARIQQHVIHINCDRYKGLSSCNLPKNAKYDAIIDFSAYDPTVIQDTLLYFGANIENYIYISTDSVYEVSIPCSTKFCKETDSIRSSSHEEQLEANRKDSYGHYKLLGEEAVLTEHESSGMNYVILRFPDVFGPRDTTYRWWAYQMWFQIFGRNGEFLHIPKGFANLKTSFVYVKDIAKVMTKIIEDLLYGERRTLNQVFNFAYPEAINIRTLLDSMQLALGLRGIEYYYSEEAVYFYPSVTRGPIDVSKVKEMLQIEFTPWTEAVQETTKFFDEALVKHQTERQKMIGKLHLIAGKDVQVVLSKVEDYLNQCNNKTRLRIRDEL